MEVTDEEVEEPDTEKLQNLADIAAGLKRDPAKFTSDEN